MTHSTENDVPRVFDAAIFRHAYNPWSGKCGCGEGPFSVDEYRGHVERAMSAKCPDCGHALPHHERWGCMSEVGDCGSGSVADAVFCKCVTSPERPWVIERNDDATLAGNPDV